MYIGNLGKVGINMSWIDLIEEFDPYDPSTPPIYGNLSGQFPMTTLLGIPAAAGHLSGTVTTSANSDPLEGALTGAAQY